jgi:arylsulfatase A-like enzyme
VHTPWVPSQGRLAEYPEGPSGPEDKRSFSAVLDEYDRQIGRLLAGLKELGLEDKTILIFSSDNGPLPSFKHARTAGFRGSKDSLYEGGIREPFIVRWPGHVAAGRFDEKTVIHGADLFPTLCAFAGATLPAGVPFDGEDMSPAILGKEQTRQRPIFWEYGRNNNKAFGYPGGKDRSPNVAMREGKWKLLVNADGSDCQLYDLDTDPNETTDIAATQPDVTARLKQMTLDWRKSLPMLAESKKE